MKNNIYEIREKINSLENTTPGVSWNKDAVWEKIEQRQKNIELFKLFRNGFAGLVVAIMLAGVIYYNKTEKSESAFENFQNAIVVKKSPVNKVNPMVNPVIYKYGIKLGVKSDKKSQRKAKMKPIVLCSYIEEENLPIEVVATETKNENPVLAEMKVQDSLQASRDTNNDSSSNAYQLEEDHRWGKVSQRDMILGREHKTFWSFLDRMKRGKN